MTDPIANLIAAAVDYIADNEPPENPGARRGWDRLAYAAHAAKAAAEARPEPKHTQANCPNVGALILYGTSWKCAECGATGSVVDGKAARPEPKQCRPACTMAKRLAGDGCDVCNPALAADLARPEPASEPSEFDACMSKAWEWRSLGDVKEGLGYALDALEALAREVRK